MPNLLHFALFFLQIFVKRFSSGICPESFFCVEGLREEKIVASGYTRIIVKVKVIITLLAFTLFQRILNV